MPRTPHNILKKKLIYNELSHSINPLLSRHDGNLTEGAISAAFWSFVVPQKNVQKLAEKIVSLLDDPEMGRSVGKEGRRFVVKRYDWDKITRQYAALIESITR